jgi:hypothetical protein
MKQDGHGSDEHRQVPVRSPDHFRSCCFKIDAALRLDALEHVGARNP